MAFHIDYNEEISVIASMREEREDFCREDKRTKILLENMAFEFDCDENSYFNLVSQSRLLAADYAGKDS
jgi:hypothetical protein